MILLRDHDTLRNYGAFTSHDPERLNALDVWLASKDPANELPDGTLPALPDRAGITQPRRKPAKRTPVPQPERQTWPQPLVRQAMWAWTERHGAPPRYHDWDHRNGVHPANSTVVARYGSWNLALVDAGFEPRDIRAGWQRGRARSVGGRRGESDA